METVTLNISRDDFLSVIDDSIKISKKRWTRFVKSQINSDNESIESPDEVICFLPDPPSPVRNNDMVNVDDKNDYNCQSLSKDAINTDNSQGVSVANSPEKSYTTSESSGATSSQSPINPIDLLFSVTNNIVPQDDDIDDEDSYSDDEDSDDEEFYISAESSNGSKEEDSYSDDDDSDVEESGVKDKSDSQSTKNGVENVNSDYFDDDPDEESDGKLNDESANGVVSNRTVFEESNDDSYSDDEDSDDEDTNEAVINLNSQFNVSSGVAGDNVAMSNISYGGSTVSTNVFSDSNSYDDDDEGNEDSYEDDEDDEFNSFSDASHKNFDSDLVNNDEAPIMQVKNNIDTLGSNSVTVNSPQTVSNSPQIGVQKLEYSSKNVEDVCKNTEPTDIINEGVNRFGHVVNFSPDMSLIAFLRANKSIREEDEILCYFTKEDIKLASRQGKILLKKGRIII